MTTVLGIDLSQSLTDEPESKLNGLKPINAEYGCDKFVVAKASRLNRAVELLCDARSLCWFTDGHQHFAILFAFPRQAPDRNHLSHRDFHAMILCNRRGFKCNRDFSTTIHRGDPIVHALMTR